GAHRRISKSSPRRRVSVMSLLMPAQPIRASFSSSPGLISPSPCPIGISTPRWLRPTRLRCPLRSAQTLPGPKLAGRGKLSSGATAIGVLLREPSWKRHGPGSLRGRGAAAAPALGFEPRTARLTVECSAVELCGIDLDDSSKLCSGAHLAMAPRPASLKHLTPRAGRRGGGLSAGLGGSAHEQLGVDRAGFCLGGLARTGGAPPGDDLEHAAGGDPAVLDR